MALCLKTSPLEIPEIVLLIGSHLDERSLLHAMRVCRMWHRLCTPLLYRTLQCTDLQHKSCYEGVRRYPHMLRSIQWYSQPDTEGVFADLATINKQLERDFSVKQRLATIAHLKKNKKTAKGLLKRADDDVIEDLDCAAAVDGSSSCHYSSQDDGCNDDDYPFDDDDDDDEDDDDDDDMDFELSEEDDHSHGRRGGGRRGRAASGRSGGGGCNGSGGGGGGGGGGGRRGHPARDYHHHHRLTGGEPGASGALPKSEMSKRMMALLRGVKAMKHLASSEPVQSVLAQMDAVMRGEGDPTRWVALTQQLAELTSMSGGGSSSSPSSSSTSPSSPPPSSLSLASSSTVTSSALTLPTTLPTLSSQQQHALHRQRLLMQLEREQEAYMLDEKELTEEEMEELLLQAHDLTSLTLFKSNRLGASLVSTVWTALPNLVTLKLHTKHLMGVEALELTELMRACPFLETLWLSGMPCTFDSEDYRDKERDKDKSHCSNFVMCTNHPGRVILRATSTTCRETDYLMLRHWRQEAEPMKFRLKEILLRNVSICVDELQDLTNHCPDLEELFLYDTLQWEWPISFFPTLAKSCPKLWSFQFDTPLRPVTEDGIIEVLEALPNLRTFGARLTHFGDRALRLLQSGACPNLTSLDVSFSRFRRLTSEQVRIFLMSYPKLKHFKADGIFLNEEQDDDDLGPAEHQNWVCTELETLLIGFHNPDNLRARNTLMYSQLRRLTKLRYLGITDTFLKISIKVGLAQLTVLKELRHFNIETSNYPKLRRSDIDWIAQNWPKLEILQIGGGGDPNTHRRVRGWLAEAGRSEIKVYSQKYM